MKDTNLIIGLKNTGKTTNYLFNSVKEAIKNNENLCIVNTRDEYFKTFSNELKNNNYNVFTLNLDEPTKSNGFNPLQVPYELYIEGKKDKAIKMVNTLALEIFKEDNPSIDPFWQNMAASYFAGLVLVLFKEGKKEEINLGSVQVMMNQGEEKLNDTTYLKKYLDDVLVTDIIYTLLSPIAYAPLETKMSIISVCKQKLNVYIAREELLNLLNTNDIDVRNINDKTAVLIIANKNKDIANIFVDELVELSNKSFTYILDNLDTFKVILSLNNLLENATYTKNKVFAAVHNKEEFKDQYGKYILDKFDIVFDLNMEKSLLINQGIQVGNDNEYPTLEKNKHEYINFKSLIK